MWAQKIIYIVFSKRARFYSSNDVLGEVIPGACILKIRVTSKHCGRVVENMPKGLRLNRNRLNESV